MADIFNMTDTWNNGATTFTAIKMDVTDTASAAASKLLDLLVGGGNRFNVGKNAFVNFYTSAGVSVVSVGGSTDDAIRVAANAFIGFSSSNTANTAPTDTRLTRDAADTLAQRRSTNPQAFRLYNTYTDASNYERGFMRWSSNVLEIGAEAAGTGTARTLRLSAPASSTPIEFYIAGGIRGSFGNAGLNVGTSMGLSAFGSGNIDTGFYRAAAGIVRVAANNTGTTGAAMEFIEQTAPAAPSANQVRIYAEDDGSGKTRLMALFATGAAQQIAIEP